MPKKAQRKVRRERVRPPLVDRLTGGDVKAEELGPIADLAARALGRWLANYAMHLLPVGDPPGLYDPGVMAPMNTLVNPTELLHAIAQILDMHEDGAFDAEQALRAIRLFADDYSDRALKRRFRTILDKHAPNLPEEQRDELAQKQVDRYKALLTFADASLEETTSTP